MSHKIDWYDANQILLWEFYDHVTPNEIDEVFQELMSVLDQAAEPIQVIIDLRSSTQVDMFLPTSMPSLAHFLRHHNLDWSAIVGITTSLAFMLKIITKAYGFQYAIFDGVDEAADFLRQVRVLQKSSSDVPDEMN